MGIMQAVRCKFGHHEWGPILGAIGESRHECENCGKVKAVKARPPRGYGGPGGNEGRHFTGGGGGSE